MKREYEKPLSLIELFNTVDVITASGNTDVQDDDNNVSWPF